LIALGAKMIEDPRMGLKSTILPPNIFNFAYKTGRTSAIQRYATAPQTASFFA
jgi:hypothetical protein